SQIGIDPTVGEAADEAVGYATATNEGGRLEVSDSAEASVGQRVKIGHLAGDDIIAAGKCPRAAGGEHVADNAVTEGATGGRDAQTAKASSVALKLAGHAWSDAAAPILSRGGFYRNQ